MKTPMWKRLGLAQPLRVVVNGRLTDPCRLHRISSRVCDRTSNQPSWKKDRHAKYYEGVTMCDEWRFSFEAFRVAARRSVAKARAARWGKSAAC